jgi:hypothetical protein
VISRRIVDVYTFVTSMPTIDPNDEPLLARHLREHPIKIASIHTQPFLGDGIVGKKTDEGWEIMLYPARYYDGWSTSMILEVLQEIDRKENRRTRFKDQDDFETLIGRFTNQVLMDQTDRSLELFEDEAWRVKGALESVFDYVDLLTEGYWTHEDVENVIQYPGLGTRNSGRALGAVALFRFRGEAIDDFESYLVRSKQYDLLRCIDAIEECLKRGAFDFSTVRLMINSVSCSPEDELTKVIDGLCSLFADRLDYDLFIKKANKRVRDLGILFGRARLSLEEGRKLVAQQLRSMATPEDSKSLVEQLLKNEPTSLFIASAELEFERNSHLAPSVATERFEHDLTPLVIDYFKAAECFLRYRMSEASSGERSTVSLDRMTFGQLRRELGKRPECYFKNLSSLEHTVHNSQRLYSLPSQFQGSSVSRVRDERGARCPRSHL